MKKNIVIFSLVVIGLIFFSIGFMSIDLRWTAFGFLTTFLPLFYFFISGREEKQKSFLQSIENKDKSILPSSEKKIRKKEIKISFFITIFISLVAFLMSWNFLANYLFKPTVSLESIINDGCAKMDTISGCTISPSEITVFYDVNNDGIKGGKNDTLAALLEKNNCRGDCILRRCGCPRY